MPGHSRILFLDMDCLFFLFLLSNSIPKALYQKTNKSVRNLKGCVVEFSIYRDFENFKAPRSFSGKYKNLTRTAP